MAWRGRRLSEGPTGGRLRVRQQRSHVSPVRRPPSTYDWPGLEAKLDLLLASLSFRKWIPQRFHDLLGSISPDCLTLEIYLNLDSFANVPSCQTVVWAVKKKIIKKARDSA